MWEFIEELLGSKKFVAALAGVISAALLRIGLDIPTEDILAIILPLIGYIIGQGIADSGKEAKKVELKLKKAA